MQHIIYCDVFFSCGRVGEEGRPLPNELDIAGLWFHDADHDVDARFLKSSVSLMSVYSISEANRYRYSKQKRSSKNIKNSVRNLPFSFGSPMTLRVDSRWKLLRDREQVGLRPESEGPVSGTVE